jgi:hypothetical protein
VSLKKLKMLKTLNLHRAAAESASAFTRPDGSNRQPSLQECSFHVTKAALQKFARETGLQDFVQLGV